jgi:hypothetical protein
MERWPSVPAVFGWLALDRRGNWRVGGEPLHHRGLVDFINRNYQADEHGRWFFQNGPQRVFAELHYTPWVLFWDGRRLTTHTGGDADIAQRAHLDEEGNLLLTFGGQIGLVCDRDLPALIDRMQTSDGHPPADAALQALLCSDDAAGLVLALEGHQLPLAPIASASVPARFGFTPRPAPDQLRP